MKQSRCVSSTTKTAIAIFAKTIGLSPVKTRLAATIGQHNAEQFYTLSLACSDACVEQLRSFDETIHNYWALAEPEAVDHSQWRNKLCLWTGEGTLGQRLHHIYSTLRQRYDTVILIGSDCPQLSSARLQQAITLCAQQPESFIVGPAVDGGFYLFAGSRDIDARCWTSVSYSESDTRQQLLEQLSRLPRADCRLLDSEFDIDSEQELLQLKTHDWGTTTTAQLAVVEWLRNYTAKNP